MGKRSTAAKLIVALTTLGGLAIAVPIATSAPVECVAEEKASPDFDGSGGDQPDVPIGVPGEDGDAGAVEVRFAGDKEPQHLTLPKPKAGDRFGHALVAEDFDQDSCTDLLVGAPGREAGGVTDAGAVFAFKGSPDGLKPWKTLTMGADGMPGEAQAGAMFGSVLDSYGGMQIAGVPRYDIDGVKDAGAVIEYDLDGSGLLSSQNTTGSGDKAEAGDYYGAQVKGLYWEGDDRAFFASAPGEDVGSAKDAGMVFDCAESTTAEPACTPITQDTEDVPGHVEAGDRFGQALAYDRALFIGIPGEDSGSVTDAGAVVAYIDYGPDGPKPIGVDQDAPGWAGTAEPGDAFGSSLTTGTASADSMIVQIGAPGEDIGSVSDAGAVNSGLFTISGSDTATFEPIDGMSGDNTASETDKGDRFGAVVQGHTFINGDGVGEPMWVIGAPGDKSGAGEVVVAKTGPAGDQKPESEVWRQSADTPEAGDGFGAVVRSLR